jgi:AbrB family looped-hinge helix DNA binding protein
MRVTSKGQVTIPQKIRELAGITPHSEVEFEFVNGTVILRKKEVMPNRGWALVEQLRGMAKGDMTTDEIMQITRGED